MVSLNPLTLTARAVRPLHDSGHDAGFTSAVKLHRVDEAAAVPTPASLPDATWMERGFDALADEQQQLWPAAGTRASQAASAFAEGLEVESEADKLVLAESTSLVQAAKATFEHCRATLHPWVHRGPHANLRYWLGWSILGLGDAVGVAGAAILLGEEIWIAVGQALATGLAAVTAGAAGHDIKELRLSRMRRREPGTLSEDERLYRRFFDDSSAGDSLLRIVAKLAGAIVVLIALAIFALRASIEGGLAGLVFGALAAATALASFMNSYAYADDVADLIAVTRLEFRREVRDYRRIGRSRSARRRAMSLAKANALVKEHDQRGQAAAHHLRSAKYQSLTANPGVVGHGPNTTQAAEDAAASQQRGIGPVSRRKVSDSGKKAPQ